MLMPILWAGEPLTQVAQVARDYHLHRCRLCQQGWLCSKPACDEQNLCIACDHSTFEREMTRRGFLKSEAP